MTCSKNTPYFYKIVILNGEMQIKFSVVFKTAAYFFNPLEVSVLLSLLAGI